MTTFEQFVQSVKDTLTESKQKQYIKSEVIDNVLYITFNKPQRMNAFSPGMYLHVVELLQNSANDDNIRMAVFQGEGKMFSSGNDLANFELVGDCEDDAIINKMNDHTYSTVLKPFQHALITYPKPMIALVHGGAIGFAFTMLGLFDYVLITKKSFFEAPLVALAQGPELCSSITFPRIFGKTKAFDIIVRGIRLSGEQISKTNFPTYTFNTPEEMKAFSKQLITELLDLDQLAIQNAKQLLNRQDIEKLIENSEKECKNQSILCSRKEVIQQAVIKRMTRPRSKL